MLSWFSALAQAQSIQNLISRVWFPFSFRKRKFSSEYWYTLASITQCFKHNCTTIVAVVVVVAFYSREASENKAKAKQFSPVWKAWDHVFYRIFSWQWRNDANAHDDDRRNRDLVYNRQLHREHQARTIAILIEETKSLFKLGNLLLGELLNHRACFILWACSKLSSSLYLLSSRVCVRCRHTQYLLCSNRSSGGEEKQKTLLLTGGNL